MKNKLILKITIGAIFGCLAFVLDRFLSFPIALLGVNDGLKITFYPLVLILVSIIVGKESGLMSGLVTAIMSQLIFPEWGITPTVFLWMIPYLGWGFLPGLLYNINTKPIFKLMLSIWVVGITISLYNSLCLYLDGLIMGYSVALTSIIIFVRLLSSFIMGFIYIPISYGLLKINISF